MEVTTVTEKSMDRVEFRRKRAEVPDVDFLRETMRVIVRGIMEAEVTESPERVP